MPAAKKKTTGMSRSEAGRKGAAARWGKASVREKTSSRAKNR